VNDKPNCGLLVPDCDGEDTEARLIGLRAWMYLCSNAALSTNAAGCNHEVIAICSKVHHPSIRSTYREACSFLTDNTQDLTLVIVGASRWSLYLFS
jgi:hypothetical protein